MQGEGGSSTDTNQEGGRKGVRVARKKVPFYLWVETMLSNCNHLDIVFTKAVKILDVELKIMSSESMREGLSGEIIMDSTAWKGRNPGEGREGWLETKEARSSPQGPWGK